MACIEVVGRIGRVRKLLLVLAILVLGVSAVAVAKPARDTSGVVYAGVTHAEGSDLYVAGDLKDKILGRGAIIYVTQVTAGPEPASALIEAKRITIYTKRGSLSGKGQATQTGDLVTDGSFKLKKGTGAYKGHKLTGTFDGSYADGVYTFNYTGRYKK